MAYNWVDRTPSLSVAADKIKKEIQVRNLGMSSYEARYHANKIIGKLAARSLDSDTFEITREEAEEAISEWERMKES